MIFDRKFPYIQKSNFLEKVIYSIVTNLLTLWFRGFRLTQILLIESANSSLQYWNIYWWLIVIHHNCGTNCEQCIMQRKDCQRFWRVSQTCCCYKNILKMSRFLTIFRHVLQSSWLMKGMIFFNVDKILLVTEGEKNKVYCKLTAEFVLLRFIESKFHHHLEKFLTTVTVPDLYNPSRYRSCCTWLLLILLQIHSWWHCTSQYPGQLFSEKEIFVTCLLNYWLSNIILNRAIFLLKIYSIEALTMNILLL